MPKPSTVVSIRISQDEWVLWDSYRETKKLTFSSFFQLIIEQYLSSSINPPLEEQSLIQGLFQNIQARLSALPHDSVLKTLNFRVAKNVLKKWDDYCASRYISRTALIHQAVNAYFNPNVEIYLKYQGPGVLPLKNIIRNLISRVGILEYTDLLSIFEGVDARILAYIINTLESEGKIARKGQYTYVSSDKPGQWPLDPVMVAEFLGQLTENFGDIPDDVESPQQLTLLTAVFQYFSTFLHELHTSWRKRDVSELTSLKEDMMNELEQKLGVSLHISKKSA